MSRPRVMVVPIHQSIRIKILKDNDRIFFWEETRSRLNRFT
jgi:hypothetical protein